MFSVWICISYFWLETLEKRKEGKEAGKKEREKRLLPRELK